MADNNQNPGIDPKALKDVFRDIAREQQDLSGAIKDILRDLNKTENAYKNIEARIDRISKGAVDIKGVQREINKLVDREFIANKANSELKKNVRQQSKDLLENAKQESIRLAESARLAGRKFDINENILSTLQAFEDHQALELFYGEQALQLAEHRRKAGENQLKIEKEVSKQMGISGNLMSMFAKKIGLGEDAYDDMSRKARKLVEDQQKLNAVQKIGARFIGGFQVLGTGIASIAKSLFQSLSDPLAIIGAGGLLIKGLKSAFDYIVGIQDQTVKFARAMNLSTGEARKIKMEFASLSVSSGDLFITSQKMVESQMELTDALGITNVLSKEILATNIKLKDIAGLEADTRAGLATTATITGQNAEQLTKSVLAQVVGLKQATGIGFQYQKILKEAATFGGVLGLQFAKYPDRLAKSLVTVKAMGLELSKLDGMADSFLDFESSISKEFEAQLLTGKDINLAKAREAFLNNDLATAAAEITKQTGNANEYLKMNRIQQDAIAGALGLSRNEMADMLKQQELLAKLGAKQGDSAKDQLRIGIERFKNQKALSEAIGEEAYQSLVNASAQEKIAAFIEKIKQSIADFVENSGIIDKVEGFIKWLSQPENIRKTVMAVRDVFATLVGLVADVASGIITALNFVGAISDSKAENAKSFLSGAEGKIRSLGGDLSGIGVSNNQARNEATTTNQTTQPTTGMSGTRLEERPVYIAINPVTGQVIEQKIEGTPYIDLNKLSGKQ